MPIMASVTFIQAGSNRGFSGRPVEGFWNSISHVPLLSVGMNCAWVRKKCGPHRRVVAAAPIYVSSHPNAGLPNPLLPTGFPETPESLALSLREWAQNGWLNIVGGCCGTTPTIFTDCGSGAQVSPSRPGRVEPFCDSVVLEALTVRPGIQFRQCRRADQHYRVTGILQTDPGRDYDKALDGGAPAGGRRGADHRHQHG